MKTMTKKLASIVLALCLCFSLVGTALAADNALTITINPAYTGETYTAYKVFDATYSVSGEGEEATTNISYTITSDSPWYTQVAAATSVFKLTEVSSNTTEVGGVEVTVITYQVTLASDDVDGNAIVAVLQPVPNGAEVAATVTTTKVEPSTTTTAELDVSASGAGYYYVTTTLGSAVAVDSASPSATISDKNQPPTVKKTVDSVTVESSDNHQTVEYEFEIDDVKGIHSLVLEDAMQVNDTEVTYSFGDFSSLTVVLVDGDDTKTLTKDVDYTLVTETGDGCDFHIEFTVNGVDYNFDNCSEDAYIYVTVNCELDALEGGFSEDEIDIPNQAMVTYGNGGNSVWVEADVYEYGFEINKVDGETKEALSGAHFELKNSSDQTAYFTEDAANGVYVLEGWGTIPAETGYTSDLVSNENGSITIEGLGEGTFTLTETQAPDGYNLMTDSITVVIAADEDDPSEFTVTVDGVAVTDYVVTVENNAGSSLPSTGGMGTTIFYIIGGVLVAGAVVVLITRRRMSSNEG